MSKTVDYYFSPSSPWTYLGHARFAEMAKRHGAVVNVKPADLGKILSQYRKVVVAELNTGQLRARLRAEYLVDAAGLNKMTGRPFTVSELVCAMERRLEEK